jgi:SAM-dependent methyltransferase
MSHMHGKGKVKHSKNVYDDQSSLGMYMLLHYGSSNDTLAPLALNAGAPMGALRFPQRCAEFVCEALRAAGGQMHSVLDAGCAVGGSSFHLATLGFKSVAAFDLSKGMIEQANAVKSALSIGRNVEFSVPVEGSKRVNVNADIMRYHNIRKRVNFFVGDACDLPQRVASLSFDAVLGANLICRVPDPLQCLSELNKVLKPGGVLCLTTPFTWMKEFTHPDKWLAGKSDESSFDALRQQLEGVGFELIVRRPMPFLIRETGRKFQFVVAEGSAWKKSMEQRSKL